MNRISSYEETRKKIRRLNLTSDVFIGKVLERPEVLEELLFLLLGKWFRIKTVQGQYSIRQLLRHSVILDLYAEEERGRIVHLEMQNRDGDDHVKRMLYCRSSIVVMLLDSGVPYEELPELYQVFVSRNDFLHTGRAVVYNRKPYPDGVTEVYFNLSSSGGAGQAMKDLQKYFLETIPENESRYFPKLVARVNFLKYQTKGVGEMCEIFDEVRREGINEGWLKGEQEGRTGAWRDTILDLLNPLGGVPEEVMRRIREQSDESCLRNWIRVAAQVSSVEEFEDRM